MKSLSQISKKTMMLGVALAACSVPALAASITGGITTTGGLVTISSTDLVFSGTTTVKTGGTITTASGSTTNFSGDTVKFASDYSFANNGNSATSGSSINPVLAMNVLFDIADTVNGSGNHLLFVVSSGAYTVNASTGTVTLPGSLRLTNSSYSGIGNEVGTFTLNTTNGMASGSFISNAAVTATPEPSSLMLLGTGLLGAAGAAFRKRSSN